MGQTLNIQMEHYNGTDYDILNPKTIADNVSTNEGQTLQQVADVSNQRFNLTTYKTTNSNLYTAWAQDKCFELNGALYMFYNEGTSHTGSDLLPKFKRSYDGGQTWSDPYILYQGDGGTYSGGLICFAAGVDATRFYSVVLCRGTDNSTANTKHYLVYGAHDNGALRDPNTMAAVEINISKNGNVPNQFHSFCALPDGSIAFGYYYLDGEVGIAKTSDLGVTWTTTPIYSSSQMLNSLNLCEVTLCYDSANSAVVGFMRSENLANFNPKFFISKDNLTTFTIYDAPIGVQQTPIPIKKVGDTYYAFYTERYNSCRMYLMSAKAIDVLNNGFSAFTTVEIGRGYHDSANSSSGMGVGSLVPDGNNLHIFFSSENPNGNVDMYHSVYKTDLNNSDIVNLNAITSKRFKEKSQIVLVANSAQSYAAATATVMDLKETMDSLSEFSANQITVKQSGLYGISLSAYLSSVPDGNQSYIEVIINGSARRIAWSNSGANANDLLNGSLIIYLTQGAVIQFKLTTQNAATLQTGTSTTFINFYRID